ncbi:transcriptional regulator FtrA [Klebsiella pneumoniae]|nr:transcriptional regulator FtrA [Klebsiella pneumoniae]SBX31735.1 AraC family transcriptional regulator [Klebsiella pneumoniae]
MTTQYGFFIDSARCTGCKTCELACKDYKNLTPEVSFRRIYEYAGGDWQEDNGVWQQNVFAYYLSIACNHCEDPACTKVCPSGAMHKREDGFVVVNEEVCIGCRYCHMACPYGAPQYNADKGHMTKCDGCHERVAQADTIVVPGWRGVDAPVPEALCAALASAHARGCRIISICSGVFVLAAAGLLNGRQATTHWRYTAALQSRFPQIQVVEDVLYVGDALLMTSAGSAAGIDLCLHLVREDFGSEAANVVARRLVVSPHRDGGQAQQVLRPVARSRESLRLGQLFDYLHQHLAASHTVASLAQRAGMGTRTFLRRFEEATGKTPARWLLEERLLRARQHLTESTMGIDQIAERCGFASAGTLRHHFRQHFALSPLQYRKQFTPSPIAKSSQPRTIDGHSKPVARRVDDEERVSGSDL